MENVIIALKEMREKAEKTFIENSLIECGSSLDGGPTPDTTSYLDTIIELNQAISTLEYSIGAKVPKKLELK
jgi:hypothetical protein